ncbi:MAG: cobalamin-binding protein [Methanobacteriota archaeon]|nr:MAG: cobalamin-binding protein [Euryarchaeota archaeon]
MAPSERTVKSDAAHCARRILMRIASLVPSATETLFALGLGDEVVGVSPECDFPAGARDKPVLSQNAIRPDTMSQAAIDRTVVEHLRDGGSLYHVDARLLEEAAPDVIFTQGLCEVCAASIEDVTSVASKLKEAPKVVSLDPTDLGGVLASIESVGRSTGREAEARDLAGSLRARLLAVEVATSHLQEVPTVGCLEWFDPLFNAGHWVPEMVEIAGGAEVLAVSGKPSVRIEWRDVLTAAPQVLVLMPCGFSVDRAVADVPLLTRLPGWRVLPAVRKGNVYAVDASSYFSRPGPRLVDGVELLAHILHPDAFPGEWPKAAMRRLAG